VFLLYMLEAKLVARLEPTTILAASLLFFLLPVVDRSLNKIIPVQDQRIKIIFRCPSIALYTVLEAGFPFSISFRFLQPTPRAML